MTNGWFIGDFEPSLFKTRHFEVAIQRFKAGEIADWHVHRIATEFTVLILGEAIVNGNKIDPGTIVTIPPGEGSNFHAITDCVTAVVKVPCVKGDKYFKDT